MANKGDKSEEQCFDHLFFFMGFSITDLPKEFLT